MSNVTRRDAGREFQMTEMVAAKSVAAVEASTVLVL